MKHLIIFTLLALTLTGCEDKERVKALRQQYISEITVEFEYKGHRYIHFSNYGGGIGGITHDPDCPCREKEGGYE